MNVGKNHRRISPRFNAGLDQLGPLHTNLKDDGLLPPPRRSKVSLNERAQRSTRARHVKIALPTLRFAS
jgi:hypothetical protein